MALSFSLLNWAMFTRGERSEIELPPSPRLTIRVSGTRGLISEIPFPSRFKVLSEAKRAKGTKFEIEFPLSDR